MDEDSTQRDELFERRLIKNQQEIDRIFDKIEEIDRNLELLRISFEGPDAKSIGSTHGNLYDWGGYEWDAWKKQKG
ncbi:uncharacterized protein METZ01_LOCUS172641 [marine metagenome]|uniref:Uncharacterized protein n=1 Tax=marine metagenome TaxID=408172 RepID=A0A382C2X4_9ZZZZ